MVEFLTEIYYRHKAVRVVFLYTLTLVGGVYTFSFLLNLYLTGEVSFSYSNWIKVFSKNFKVILMMYSSVLIILLVVIFYLNQKYRLIEKKHSRYEIPLSVLAARWTTVKEVTEEDNKSNTEDAIEEKNNIDVSLVEYIKFNDKSIDRFFQTSVYHKIDNFTSYEVKLIINILNVLAEYGSCSSVADYKKDVEILNLDSMDSIAKAVSKKNLEKSNHELLGQVSIKKHTIGVADAALKFYKEELKENPDQDYVTHGSVVIAALAHDLGKIAKYASGILSIAEHLIKANPHVTLSIDIVNKIASDYPRIKMVSNAISSHHSKKVPSELLSAIIFKADKIAREKESKELIDELKKSTSLEKSQM